VNKRVALNWAISYWQMRVSALYAERVNTVNLPMMKLRTQNKKHTAVSRAKNLKNSRRRDKCETSLSRKLPHGEEKPPDPQGACARDTTVQGSE
jgi:hypothetical protein